ncbi:MAG: glycosyltransferase [Nitrososphaerota archaeon]|nr:glycosyltransferase [Nitrososphaerota archaeon]
MGSLSVVVLTRNSERTIGQVLGALVGNEDVLDHVVIVDGNSRDRTIEIARGFSDRLDVVFLSDEGKGLGYARDIGWRATDSPYVMMLDSDVVVRRWFMEEAVELLQRDGQLGGVSAKLRPVIEGRGWLTVFQAKNLAIHLHLSEPTYPAEAVALHTACTVFRRSALMEVGGFDHYFRLAKEDSDISFRLRKAGYRLSYLDVEALHLERARFWRTNFRYGRSYVHIAEKHPDMAPLPTLKNAVLTAALFFPPFQLPVYLHYLRRYAKLDDLAPKEKVVLPAIEVVRQALRTSGTIYELIRRLVGAG